MAFSSDLHRNEFQEIWPILLTDNIREARRALKRLVETNIISGHYDVARKYISILEETLLYRKWAQSMRVLVDNPKLIENNPFLQSGREEYAKTADIFFI